MLSNASKKNEGGIWYQLIIFLPQKLIGYHNNVTYATAA